MAFFKIKVKMSSFNCIKRFFIFLHLKTYVKVSNECVIRRSEPLLVRGT